MPLSCSNLDQLSTAHTQRLQISISTHRSEQKSEPSLKRIHPTTHSLKVSNPELHRWGEVESTSIRRVSFPERNIFLWGINTLYLSAFICSKRKEKNMDSMGVNGSVSQCQLVYEICTEWTMKKCTCILLGKQLSYGLSVYLHGESTKLWGNTSFSRQQVSRNTKKNQNCIYWQRNLILGDGVSQVQQFKNNNNI